MLQEIDYNTKRNKNQDFTTQLAAELGLFSVFGKAMDTGGGEYGVAIPDVVRRRDQWEALEAFLF